MQKIAAVSKIGKKNHKRFYGFVLILLLWQFFSVVMYKMYELSKSGKGLRSPNLAYEGKTFKFEGGHGFESFDQVHFIFNAKCTQENAEKPCFQSIDESGAVTERFRVFSPPNDHNYYLAEGALHGDTRASFQSILAFTECDRAQILGDQGNACLWSLRREKNKNRKNSKKEEWILSSSFQFVEIMSETVEEIFSHVLIAVEMQSSDEEIQRISNILTTWGRNIPKNINICFFVPRHRFDEVRFFVDKMQHEQISLVPKDARGGNTQGGK